MVLELQSSQPNQPATSHLRHRHTKDIALQAGNTDCTADPSRAARSMQSIYIIHQSMASTSVDLSIEKHDGERHNSERMARSF